MHFSQLTRILEIRNVKGGQDSARLRKRRLLRIRRRGRLSGFLPKKEVSRCDLGPR